MTTKQINKIGQHAGFYSSQDGLDTVVFVHGLRGHYQTTWGKFPALLNSDPDLPHLDVLLWGYKTGAFRPLVHDTKTIGRHFVSTLGVHIMKGNALYIVGHSMGGLIVLEGLVQEMVKQRA